MKDNIKTPHQSTQQNDFETQWRHRQQWEERAEKSVPDDQTFLHWVEKAQQASGISEVNVTPLPLHRNRRWIPYAAAASIVIGMAIIGLTHTGRSNDGLPMTEEVTVESQTIHFMCNNDCSAQDIMVLANKAFKE
jgi:hypothetical protein